MRKLALAIALGLPIAPMQAHALTDVFRFGNAGGSAFGFFVLDSCRTGDFSITASADGEKNNVKSNTPVAFANIFVFDSCANSFACWLGFTNNNIQFSVPPGTTANQVPKSVTASGVIPLEDFCASTPTPPTDSLTFSMQLKANGFVVQDRSNSHRIFTPAKKREFIFSSHFDFNQSLATGTVTISTQNQGTIPTSDVFLQVFSSRSHSVAITH